MQIGSSLSALRRLQSRHTGAIVPGFAAGKHISVNETVTARNVPWVSFVFMNPTAIKASWGFLMEAIFQSFGLVVASEMGDKTQLLALILALRFKKPWTVMAGILVATLLNHGLATVVGGWIGSQVPENVLRIGLAVVFFAFAFWILVPDKMDETEGQHHDQASAFWATLVLFFIAEMGDKTQLATVALGAKFQMPVAVTIGTTLGMLVADGLAVVFGEKLTKIIPMKFIRIASSLLFATFGVAIVMGWG